MPREHRHPEPSVDYPERSLTFCLPFPALRSVGLQWGRLPGRLPGRLLGRLPRREKMKSRAVLVVCRSAALVETETGQPQASHLHPYQPPLRRAHLERALKTALQLALCLL